MGGVILDVTGTAYGDPQTLYDAWQRAIAAKAGFCGGFANDTVDTDIDGVVITIRREFMLRPDQMSVTVGTEPPPLPENVVKYVNTSVGVPLYGRKLPTTAGVIVARMNRGDKLELKPGWTATANGFTWWQILKVNGVAVPADTPTYAVDKYMSDTDPNL